MAFEQDITALVTATDQLTGVVDNKIGEIDNKVAQAQQKLNDWADSREQIGDGTQGSMNLNVAHGFFANSGGLPKQYYHVKLPIKLDTHNEMFWFNIRGYNYGEGRIINETFVGYCYKNGNALVNMNVDGTHVPTIYVGSDQHIYCRMETNASSYYVTLSVDTMRVGNGRLFTPDEVELIQSGEAEL